MMDDQSTMYVLSDIELDAVTGGKKGGGGGGNTVVEIVEISIGEIIATGHSKVIVDVVGIGNSTGGHKRH